MVIFFVNAIGRKGAEAKKTLGEIDCHWVSWFDKVLMINVYLL